MESQTKVQKILKSSEEVRFLKSSPNILENFPYEDFQMDRIQPKRMTSPPLQMRRSKSPRFSDTVERNAFMRHVIEPTRYSPPSKKEAHARKSLEELSKDIKEIEDFLTKSEQIIKNEKCLEMELKKLRKAKPSVNSATNKENKTPSPVKSKHGGSSQSFNYKINAYKNRRNKPLSPKLLNSRLYFRNGRIGCVEAERQTTSNIESTHALVKHILQYEKHQPLVSPESVRKVLSAGSNQASQSQRRASCKDYEQNHQVNLPGSIMDPEDDDDDGDDDDGDDDEAAAELDNEEEDQEDIIKPMDPLSIATGRVLLNHIEAKPMLSNEEAFDSDSQPVTEEVLQPNKPNEDKMELCYNESPDIQNNEENCCPLEETEIISDSLAQEEGETEEKKCPEEGGSLNRPLSAISMDSASQQFVRNQVRHLVRRFTARAKQVKSRIEMPPTPSSSTSSPSPPPHTPQPPTARQDDEMMKKPPEKSLSPGSSKSLKTAANPLQTPKKATRLFEADTPRSNQWLCSSLCGSNNDEKTLDPQGKIYISWLCVVSISFLYNAWVIPLRSAFPFQTKENTNAWLICDFCADIVYLLDVIFFKHRLMYLFEGFWVKNKNLTRKNYMRKLQFKLDLLALLPLDLFYLKLGTGAVYLRCPRLFKIQSFWEFFKLLDRVTSSPHIIRVAKTLTYMLYMIHLTATFYYAYSSHIGLGTNRWVFSGKGHPYVRCFAFATKTATSIGKNPKPENVGEYVFMTAAWLMGVFVFALLIGQIRDIISTATRNKNEYRQLEDETLEYMRRLNLPKDVQKRVKMWFKFTWDQQRTLDEANILDALPINLKTDIAILVHIQTLSKVQLFADCDEALLRDLVLKLRAVTFLPGDYVCRKGEVGREMYIIKLGQVQVMGGPNNDVVLATLSESSVFGEISLLGIKGADRRTADVRSKGYSNLFVLSKSDLNEVIAYYPSAQNILKKRARALMRKNAEREKEEARAKSALKADVVIGNPKTPEAQPKLLQTVIQALPYESPAVMLITRGSRKGRKDRKQATKPAADTKSLDDKEVQDINQCQSQHPGRLSGERTNSFVVRNDRTSPDLLSSIQNELKTQNKCINLTDSEKALILNASSNAEPKDATTQQQKSEETKEN